MFWNVNLSKKKGLNQLRLQKKFLQLTNKSFLSSKSYSGPEFYLLKYCAYLFIFLEKHLKKIRTACSVCLLSYCSRSGSFWLLPFALQLGLTLNILNPCFFV